jgi:hypothetical protein
MSDKKVIYYNEFSENNFYQELMYHDPLDLNEMVTPNNRIFDSKLNGRQNIMNMFNNPENCLMPNDNPYKTNFISRLGEYFGDYICALGYVCKSVRPTSRFEGYNILNFDNDPIPDIPNGWNMSFDDVIEERSRELWEIGKPIRLWWSGGIDSTCALVGLLQTKELSDDLIVYYSEESVTENPKFFNLLQGLSVTLQKHSTNIDNFFVNDANNWNNETINVQGNGGGEIYLSLGGVIDLIMGRTDWKELFNNEEFNNRYMMYNSDHPNHEFHKPRFMDFLEDYVLKSPVDIKTPWDFLWWLVYTTKYRSEFQYTFAPQIVDNKFFKSEISFFHSNNIEIWSMLNHETGGHKNYDPSSYKFSSKRYIYDFDKNEHYFKNKTKNSSPPMVWKNKNRINFKNAIWHPTKLGFSDNTICNANEVFRGDCWDLFDKNTFDKYKKRM